MDPFFLFSFFSMNVGASENEAYAPRVVRDHRGATKCGAFEEALEGKGR